MTFPRCQCGRAKATHERLTGERLCTLCFREQGKRIHEGLNPVPLDPVVIEPILCVVCTTVIDPATHLTSGGVVDGQPACEPCARDIIRTQSFVQTGTKTGRYKAGSIGPESDPSRFPSRTPILPDLPDLPSNAVDICCDAMFTATPSGVAQCPTHGGYAHSRKCSGCYKLTHVGNLQNPHRLVPCHYCKAPTTGEHRVIGTSIMTPDPKPSRPLTDVQVNEFASVTKAVTPGATPKKSAAVRAKLREDVRGRTERTPDLAPSNVQPAPLTHERLRTKSWGQRKLDKAKYNADAEKWNEKKVKPDGLPVPVYLTDGQGCPLVVPISHLKAHVAWGEAGQPSTRQVDMRQGSNPGMYEFTLPADLIRQRGAGRYDYEVFVGAEPIQHGSRLSQRIAATFTVHAPDAKPFQQPATTAIPCMGCQQPMQVRSGALEPQGFTTDGTQTVWHIVCLKRRQREGNPRKRSRLQKLTEYAEAYGGKLTPAQLQQAVEYDELKANEAKPEVVTRRSPATSRYGGSPPGRAYLCQGCGFSVVPAHKTAFQDERNNPWHRGCYLIRNSPDSIPKEIRVVWSPLIGTMQETRARYQQSPPSPDGYRSVFTDMAQCVEMVKELLATTGPSDDTTRVLYDTLHHLWRKFTYQSRTITLAQTAEYPEGRRVLLQALEERGVPIPSAHVRQWPTAWNSGYRGRFDPDDLHKAATSFIPAD